MKAYISKIFKSQRDEHKTINLTRVFPRLLEKIMATGKMDFNPIWKVLLDNLVFCAVLYSGSGPCVAVRGVFVKEMAQE